MKHELEIKTRNLHQPENHGRRDSPHHHGDVPPRWGPLAPPQREIDTQKQRERTQSRLKPYIHIPSAHKKYRWGGWGSRHPHGSHRAYSHPPTRLCRGCAPAGPSWASGGLEPARASGGARASHRACGSTQSHWPRGCDRGYPYR
jgi:hypothetical protein